MVRQVWCLILSLTIFALTTILGYARWQEHVSIRFASRNNDVDIRTPSPRSQPRPAGNASAVDGLQEVRKKKGPISYYITAENVSSWPCTVDFVPKPRSGEWQIVLEDAAYVYSAYLDPRSPNSTLIRVFGMLSKNVLTRHKYYCMAWGEDRTGAMVTEATLLLTGRSRSSFGSVQFQCQYKNLQDLTAVSMTTYECSAPNNAVSVTRLMKQRQKRDFTVCLCGPLKHGYNNTNQFVEWIEINRLLGAKLFYVYSYSIGKELVPYLKYYQSEEIIKLVPWKIPFSLDFDPIKGHEFDTFRRLWNYGQEILISDCLYRNMYASRYVVFQDLDELIVPHQPDVMTWSEMIQTSGCNANQTAVYVARNTFFTPGGVADPDDRLPEEEVALYNNSILTSNQREDYVFEAKHRSKYIAIPDLVIVPYIHVVPETLKGKTQCVFSLNESLLHHYRHHNPGRPLTIDHTLDKYKDKVTVSFRLVNKRVKQLSSLSVKRTT